MAVFLNSGGGRTELINLFLNSLEFKMQHNPIHRLAGYQSSDLAVFSRYVPAQQKTEEGYLTDWLGIEHSLADLPFLDSKLSGHAISGIPVPSDAIHAEAVEYLSLFAAMETSNETFSMMELGAGWAPWICSGGVVAKRMGKKKIHLIGVEAEGNKVPLMKRHLCKNGLCASTDFDEHTENDGVEIALYHGVINDGTKTFIPSVDIEDYGASLVTDTPFKDRPMEEVTGYTMAELTDGMDVVDLAHVDIQGYEQELVRDQVDVFASKVRWIGIGTHSRKIESFLLGFLPEHGFQIFREMPCAFRRFAQKPESMVDVTTVDGFQIWKNTGLVEKDPF